MKWMPLVGLLVATAFLGESCKGERGGSPTIADTVPQMMEEAQLIGMHDYGDFVKVDIVNPWDTAAMLKRYVLVAKGDEPDSLPEGYTRIDVPLNRSLVYSGVHAGLVGELGAADAVAGVADGGYFTTEPFVSRLKRGEIVDVGPSQSPSLEAIVKLQPDAALVSPFENAGYGVLDNSGVTVVECADYMEDTPLGRAEWMRFIGRLYGKGSEADSLYAAVKERYEQGKQVALRYEEKPIVLTEMLTDGYWFVPGGQSYMARLIQDAGGEYPWAADKSRGSLQLDFSSVYARAADADIWLIRSFGRDLTLDDIQSVYLLNGQFKAFKHGNVWVANTAVVPLFEEFPFHPDLLLTEYLTLFHPDAEAAPLRYFRKSRP